MAWDDAPPKPDELKTTSGSWDSAPPTAQELGKPSFAEFDKNVEGGVANFAKGVAHLARSAANYPLDVAKSGAEVAAGGKISETPVAEDLKAVGHGVVEGVKSIPGSIVDLASPKAWYKNPVPNATTLASILVPALKGEGAAAEVAAKGAVEGVEPSIAKRAVAKTISATLGPPEDAILARMKNPTAVKNAVPLTDISENLVGATSKLQSQIEDASTAARKLLRKGYEGDTPENLGDGAIGKVAPRKSGAVSSTNVESIINQTKKNLGVYGGGVVGPADKKAVQILEGIQDDINQVGKNVGGKLQSAMGADSIVKKSVNLPESTVGDIIRKLDSNINWADESATTANTALERVRTQLDDVLKTQNPAYKKAMIPVDEKMRLMGDVKRQFNVSSQPGGDWQAGTATEGKLSNLLGPNKSKVIDTLKNLELHTGDDIHSQVQNFKTSQAFSGGRANGARRVAFGTAVGTGAGKLMGNSALGAMLGSTAGLLADSYGGQMAGKIVDVLASPTMSKYGPMFEKAAVKGPAAVAATHAFLLDSDPGYAQAMSDAGVSGQPLTKQRVASGTR